MTSSPLIVSSFSSVLYNKRILTIQKRRAKSTRWLNTKAKSFWSSTPPPNVALPRNLLVLRTFGKRWTKSTQENSSSSAFPVTSLVLKTPAATTKSRTFAKSIMASLSLFSRRSMLTETMQLRSSLGWRVTYPVYLAWSASNGTLKSSWSILMANLLRDGHQRPSPKVWSVLSRSRSPKARRLPKTFEHKHILKNFLPLC